MAKTNELIKLIVSELNKLTGVTYYKHAAAGAAYPYKVFTLSSIDLGNRGRDDVTLTIQVWDYDKSAKRADDIADDIEELLDEANLPNEAILPTFFKTGRRVIEDNDQNVQRIELDFLVQNYKNN